MQHKTQPSPDPLKGFSTDLSVGDILRRARLKRNLSIQDVEMAIRVSAQHITAIEEGRLEVLPGRIYALGFIKAYADHVGLNAEKILELLKRQAGEKIAPPPSLATDPIMVEDFSFPTWRVLGLVVLLLISVFTFKSYYTGQSYLLEQQIPKVPKELIAQTTLSPKPEAIQPSAGQYSSSSAMDFLAGGNTLPSSTPQPIISAEEQILPPPVAGQIVLKAVENVWLEIRDAKRQSIFSRVLSVGEEYWIPVDQKDLTMTLGNAGGLQIIIDGQALPFLGKTGQVIRKVYLDSEKLKETLKNTPKQAM